MPTPSGWNRAKWNKANADLANEPFDKMFDTPYIREIERRLKVANDIIDDLTKEISVLTVNGSLAFRRCLPSPQTLRDATDENLTDTLSVALPIAEWKEIAETASLFEDLMIRNPEGWKRI